MATPGTRIKPRQIRLICAVARARWIRSRFAPIGVFGGVPAQVAGTD
jgi:hypothetical protein